MQCPVVCIVWKCQCLDIEVWIAKLPAHWNWIAFQCRFCWYSLRDTFDVCGPFLNELWISSERLFTNKLTLRYSLHIIFKVNILSHTVFPPKIPLPFQHICKHFNIWFGLFCFVSVICTLKGITMTHHIWFGLFLRERHRRGILA